MNDHLHHVDPHTDAATMGHGELLLDVATAHQCDLPMDAGYEDPEAGMPANPTLVDEDA